MLSRLVAAGVVCASLAAFGSEPSESTAGALPANAATPIVTLRYFRIKKGSFPAFLEASEEGVWPFFEKIGARPLGMWRLIDPGDAGGSHVPASPEYDEVWLATGYASIEHWRATRDMASMGGTGEDYRKAMEALRVREALTLETNVRFMEGTTWTHPPLFVR